MQISHEKETLSHVLTGRRISREDGNAEGVDGRCRLEAHVRQLHAFFELHLVSLNVGLAIQPSNQPTILGFL